MSEEQKDEQKLGLSMPQILAGAAAAASAAFASSWLGVAGTVVGAAVMSVVASVAAALYMRPLERSHERLRQAIPVRPSAVAAPRTGDPNDTTVLPDSAGVGDTAVLVRHVDAFEDAQEDQSDVVPDKTESRRQIPWRMVAVSSGVMLVLGLVILTGFELLAGQSASLTGGGRDRSPIVELFDGDDSGDSGDPRRDGQNQDGDSGESTEPADPGATSAPAPTEPATTQPAPTEPTATEPAPTEPTTTEPAPTEPATTQPAPTEPAQTELGATAPDAAE